MNEGERYYQLVIEAKPERVQYTTPVWRIISKREDLGFKIAALQLNEKVTVTKIIDEDTGREVMLP